jgi:tetratricopeptide (TPR) repeat protein
MTHLALRPQPLGIYPLPAGYLVLPDVPDAEAALADLIQGCVPAELPQAWQFYRRALDGDLLGAFASLADDHSPLAQYNRFVLDSTPEGYAQLRSELRGELAMLRDLIAYTLGWLDAPPPFAEATGELRAVILSAHAAAALECDNLAEAQTHLSEAVAAARLVAPPLAAQLLADLADVRLAHSAAGAQAVQDYRAALQLLTNSGMAELRAQLWMRLGMLYQELAQGQRGALLEAARCYQEALRYFTRAEHPELFALVQNNLALAYLAMPLVEASDQLRMAIAVQALREALQVYTPETHPDRWASAQLNLANALQYMPSGRPEEHLVEAIERYEGLLDAHDPIADPLRFARILANQGNAMAHLGVFVHARPKLQEAARFFAAAGDHESAASVRELLGQIETTEREQRDNGSVSAPAV